VNLNDTLLGCGALLLFAFALIAFELALDSKRRK